MRYRAPCLPWSAPERPFQVIDIWGYDRKLGFVSQTRAALGFTLLFPRWGICDSPGGLAEERPVKKAALSANDALGLFRDCTSKLLI